MFEPIFARAASKKSEFILNRITSLLESSHKKVMLLVPEQSSFETEKELYLSLGDKNFARLEVVSFTRLCSLIKARYGFNGGERLSAAGKLILTSCAVKNAAPSLCIYASQVKNTAFAAEASSIFDELMVAGVSAENFKDGLESLKDDEILYKKLSDISVIYDWYEALLKKGYLDPSSELCSASQKVEGDFFENYHIIIDEFASFNGAQLSIIEKMFCSAPSVSVILCADKPSCRLPASVFRTPLDTYSKLLNLCRKSSCEVKTPVCLTAGESFNSPSLATLEELVSAKTPVCSINDGAISISSALSVKQECRSIAAKVRNLVKDGKIRYRDITVICRDMDGYLSYLEDSFRLYDIPFFADLRSNIDSRPAVIFINSLIETIISDIEPTVLIKYLKCPISPVSSDDAAELENYIDLWHLGKKDMLSDFVKNPAGLDGEIDENDLIRLSRLNEIRKAAVSPLIELKNKLYRADVSQITRAIYSFMKQNSVLERLDSLTCELSELDSALAGEQYRAYQVCLSVMSQLSALLKEEQITLKYYLELFKAAINTEDVGSIPHHLDEVQVGDAVRMRAGGTRIVFLVGMNEGIFPKRHTDSGLFSDRDRKNVRAAGIDIMTPSNVMNQNEDYYLYCALTSASDKLFISYCKNNLQGEPIFESKIVNKIKKFFSIEENNISTEPIENLLGSDAANFELLCRLYHTNDEFSESLRQYFEKYADESYRIKLSSIDRGLSSKAQTLSEEQAQTLYGTPMMVSPSQIEKYHLCQFAHFCRYGLKLNPLKVAEITAIDTGNAIHEVMERLLKNYSVSELALLSESDLSSLCDEYLKEFVSLRLGSSVFDDNRILYSIKRLRLTIVPVIRYVVRELEASGYTPQDFELNISRGRDIEPYMISSESGKQVGVFGKVDRVDTFKGEESTYIRVIDYKSGGKAFSRDELDYGLNLQMFLYLFSILKNGGSRYNDTLTPSGVLYMPAKRSEVTRKEGASQESINKEIEKGYKMNGLLLDDEQNQKTAPFSTASFKDISEFSLIQNKIEELIGKMADELISGNLSVNPLYVGRENKACKYCDFHKICGFEEGDDCRKINRSEEARSDG